MSAIVVQTADPTPTAERPRLVLVRQAPSCVRIDVLAVSGAVLLIAAVIAGLVDVVHVSTGGDPVGLSMLLLVAALPGLTVWAHRLDRRCGRGGRR